MYNVGSDPVTQLNLKNVLIFASLKSGGSTDI